MAKFSNGDLVTVAARIGTFIVHDGIPDCDGDIKVVSTQSRGGKDWFFAREASCTHFVPTAVPAPTPQQPTAASCGTSNQEGNSNMANVNRQIVHVVLIDQDAGLDVSKSLVKDFGQHVLEGSQEDLKMQIVMSNNMESILRGHNEVRAKEVDLDIRQRTGNEVKLQPKKLHELTWKIGIVA